MKKIYIYHYTHFSWDEEQWQYISNKTFVDVHCIVRVKGAKYLPWEKKRKKEKVPS